MSPTLVATYAKIEAVKARVEGMKSRNELAKIHGDHPYWNEHEFNWAADELTALADEALKQEPPHANATP